MSTPYETAAADLASLNRVDHKLALTSSEQLPMVLDKLLPRLLARIGKNQENLQQDPGQVAQIYQQIHEKLVSMVSHIMTRVKSDEQCPLPCREILELLVETKEKKDVRDSTTPASTLHAAKINPYTLNLALAFLTLGIPRMKTSTDVLLPSLLVIWTAYDESSAASSQVAYLLLWALECLVRDGQNVPETVRQLLSAQSDVAQALFELLLDGLFMPYNLMQTTSTLPSPGLSQASQERFRKPIFANVKWKDSKLAILTLVAPTRQWALLNRISHSLTLLVVARGDPHTDVVERASSYLKAHYDKERTSESTTTDRSELVLLLSLALGEVNAQATLHEIIPILCQEYDSPTPSSLIRPLSTQLARRMCSEAVASSIWQHCSKIMDETPHLLLHLDQAMVIGSLAVSSISSVLATPTTVHQRQAAALLQSLTIRLTASPTVLESPDVLKLLEKSLSLSSSVLRKSPSRDQHDVRNACYGTLCALARCQNFDVISDGKETAALLFGCAASEEESLRSRAVAALDALLEAFTRLYKPRDDTTASLDAEKQKDIVRSNPWSEISPPTTSALVDFNASSDTQSGREFLAKSLLPLLWNASSRSKASRVAAAQWTSQLLKLLDLTNACHLLCYLAGDTDVTTAAISRQGLGLDDDGDAQVMKLPDFSDVTRIIFVEPDASSRPCFRSFTYHGKAAALRFGLNCLLNDLYGGEDKAVEIYMRALCDTLDYFKNSSASHGRESVDLLDETSISFSGCISASQFARSLIVQQKACITIDDLRHLVVDVHSSKARRHLAESIGRLLEDYQLWRTSDLPMSLSDWLSACNLAESLKTCLQNLVAVETGSYQTGEAHGSAFLAARSIRALRVLSIETKQTEVLVETQNLILELSSGILESLGKGTNHADEVIGNACAQSLDISLSYDAQDAPMLLPPLYKGVCSALLDVVKALRRFLNGDHTDPTRAMYLLNATGTLLAASTSAAGYVSDLVAIGSARLQCIDALFEAIGSSAFRKDPEVALVAGEALASYADAYSPETVWNTQSEEWPITEFNEDFFNKLPPHEQVLYGLLYREIKASSPHKRTAVAPALLAVIAHAARSVNRNPSNSIRSLAVGLVKILPDVQTSFITLLADPKCKQLSRESCCLGLAACQGLALFAKSDTLQKKASSLSLKDSLDVALLRAFGQSSNLGGSAMMESREQNAARLRRENRESGNPSITEPFGIDESTEVGGAAGLGEAALGAYREMASAAVALGRSDILYALLILSVSHPVWRSPGSRDKYGASSLIGEQSLVGEGKNAIEIRNALRPHIAKLIPRLLRAKNDPNKQTREQMETLWMGLTGGGAEARQLVSDNLLSTIDTLIDDAMNKLWRARVGSCGALAEVIVGRSWEELGGGSAVLNNDEVILRTSTATTQAGVRLLRLWRVAMRALDDVRQAVRESGQTLARSVRALTIRLCDHSTTLSTVETLLVGDNDRNRVEQTTQAASATSLRWLVKNGLDQKCPEAAGVCVSCLIGIIEVVRPVALEPVLPELVGSLLLAMSSLEPSALNYLQVRAGAESSDTYERLELARLQFAQSGPVAMALNKCLDLVPKVGISTQQALISQLDFALRAGAGFATRAATADSTSSLCNSCPGAFKFHGANSTNPTVRLLRALYYASEKERGAGAKDKMSHALGNVASLSPGQSVRSLALKACDRYCTATGSHDDPATRRAAAAAIRSIVVRASNQVKDGGPNDIWKRKVLPIAFLGQRDKETKISALWKEVWDEGGSSLDVSRSDYGVLVEERILPGLVSACVEALEDVSWARRIAGATCLSELCNKGVLSPMPRSPNEGTTDASSDQIERATRRAVAANAALNSCLKLLMKPKLWTGKSAVAKATVDIAAKWATLEPVPAFPGWDKRTVCPWLPIDLSVTEGSADLFVGDRFFDGVDVVEAETDESAHQEGRETEAEIDEADAPIDFSEGDKFLSEQDTDCEDSEMREGEKVSVVSFMGISRFLLEQALPPTRKMLETNSQDEALPYRAAALQGLEDLMKTLQSSRREDSFILLKALYSNSISRLLAVIDSESIVIETVEFVKDEAPLIVARALSCLAASIFEGIGSSELAEQNALLLARILQNAGGAKQGAWTVREAAASCASNLARLCNSQSLRRHELPAVFLECAKNALKDRKFWRVRFSGLKILRCLASRAGVGSQTLRSISQNPKTTPSDENEQLILEALLPFKEEILQLARSSLSDSQPEVTAVASEVCGLLSWWP